MFTIVNLLDSKVIHELKSKKALIDICITIANENDDRKAPINNVNECFEYINEYSENLALLLDSRVKLFLETYGDKVRKNESESYIEFMMDNHKCIEWKKKQYYIPEDAMYNEEEEKIYDVLAYALHV
jgi:hypothetical protein